MTSDLSNSPTGQVRSDPPHTLTPHRTPPDPPTLTPPYSTGVINPLSTLVYSAVVDNLWYQSGQILTSRR